MIGQLEVFIAPHEEERPDLCPLHCPGCQAYNDEPGAVGPVGFRCHALKRYTEETRRFPQELESKIVGADENGNYGIFEIFRHKECPLKTSATPER